MNESPVINKDTVADYSTDLLALKEQGVNKLQTLSRNNWTDYNLHDPGITILETLCYALSDLAYRAGFDINDILYTPANRKIGNTLFLPHEIFTTSPLSLLDFKGLILDVEGVKNCEIIPSSNSHVIPGSFDVKLEIHPDFDDENTRNTIQKTIADLLNENRPVGIIFDQIQFLEFDLVGFHIDIELNDDNDVKKIFSAIIEEIQNYLSPEIKFKSLEELIAKEIPIDTIFTGPLLKSGFLLDNEIKEHQLKKYLYASDIISCLLKIEGLAYVKDLKITDHENVEYNWIYNVSEGRVPRIDPSKSKFIFRYKKMIVFESTSQSIELFNITKLNHFSSHTKNNLKEISGVEKQLSKYYSIQNDFPAVYGIGDKGPQAGTTPEKLGAIRQLKGYLMIYDQIMTNFLSQLNHVKYLFSTEDIDRSYAVQLIHDIPGIEYLYKSFIENYFINHNNLDDKNNLRREWNSFLAVNRNKLQNEIQSSFETKDDFLIRRNKVLDHLLARFGIDTLKIEVLSEMIPLDSIQYKLDLLRNFPKLSYEKYSMGKSSVIEHETGLLAWLKKNANLKGPSNDKISAVNDRISKSNSESNLTIQIYSDKNQINTLLKYGSEIENYILTGENELSILNDSSEVTAKIILSESIENNDIRQFVYDKIHELDRTSENFLLIDHITLKPSNNLPCFGFDVILNQTIFFKSQRIYTLTECNAFILEFTSQGQAKENYIIIETSLKEFRIEFKNKFGTLLSRNYYSSFHEANDFLELFLNMSRNNTLTYNFCTKYENHYVNLSNPFSYIISILIPSWPSKFQNDGYKKYLEDYLNQELPSHLVVNLKWLNLEEMSNFEANWETYLNSLKSDATELKLKSLDTIMTSLVF